MIFSIRDLAAFIKVYATELVPIVSLDLLSIFLTAPRTLTIPRRRATHKIATRSTRKSYIYFRMMRYNLNEPSCK